jgi:hypothetical protein
MIDYNNILKGLNAAAKILRVLYEAGCDFSGPMKSPQKRNNLARYLSLGCPAFDANGIVRTGILPEGYDLARLILGADFIDTSQASKAFGFVYTDYQLEGLEARLPDFETLMWYRFNGYALWATPPSPLNLLQVRDLNPAIFSSKKDVWYGQEKQKFARDETLAPADWLAIRKSVVPNSLGNDWDAQNLLLQSCERVPMAVEVAYAVSLLYKAIDVRLFEKLYVRTSSRSAVDQRVYLGGFDSQGLKVRSYWNDGRGSLLGLSSSLNED